MTAVTSGSKAALSSEAYERKLARGREHYRLHGRKLTPKEVSRRAAHRAENRAYIDAIKIERGCTDCGYRAHACALDFDHVRGEKKFNLGTTACWSRRLLDEEIAKCEVVCANCHRVRTKERCQW